MRGIQATLLRVALPRKPLKTIDAPHRHLASYSTRSSRMKLLGQFISLFAVIGLFASSAEARIRDYDPIPETINRTQDIDYIEDLTLKVEVYDVRTVRRRVKDQYWALDCMDIPGIGRGYWHNYWSLPQSQKPRALSDAIRGLGYSTAKKIVYSTNYFRRKPRTWNAFKSEIRRISEDRYANAHEIYTNVIRKYGKENASNLGYWSIAHHTHCHWVLVSDNYYVEERVRNYLHTEETVINVSFEGGFLIGGEREKLRAEWDGERVTFTSISTLHDYDFYQDENDEQTYILRATNRRQISPKINHFRISLFSERRDLKLKITDYLHEELQEYYPDSYVEAEITIYRDRWGFDKKVGKGIISFDSWTSEINLNQNHHIILNEGLRRGQIYYVYVKIRRPNAHVFKKSWTKRYQTPLVKY